MFNRNSKRHHKQFQVQFAHTGEATEIPYDIYAEFTDFIDSFITQRRQTF